MIGLKGPFPLRFIATSLLVPWLIVGCDAGSFTPPRPSELPGGSPAAATPRNGSATPDLSAKGEGRGSAPQARTVELILCRAQTGDRVVLEQVLRREFGKARVSLRMIKPEGEKTLSARRLAEEIRAAVSRRVDLLLLEQLDTPEVRAALTKRSLAESPSCSWTYRCLRSSPPGTSL